jgi:hypothetical protein
VIRALALALAAAVAGGPVAEAASAGQNVGKLAVNREYQISLRFPSDAVVCPALSGEHAHGFYAVWGGKRVPCGASDSGGAMSGMGVYADYNTENLKTRDEYLKGECDIPDAARRPVSVRLPYRWKACELAKADGSIEIVAVAQGGVRPNPPEPEEAGAAYINYMASLSTNARRWEADVRKFEQMMLSVRFGPGP